MELAEGSMYVKPEVHADSRPGSCLMGGRREDLGKN
jgi:hypothetical protein